MKLEECTVAQLDAILNDIDAERLNLKERGRKIMLIRQKRQAEEQQAKKQRMAEVRRAMVVPVELGLEKN